MALTVTPFFATYSASVLVSLRSTWWSSGQKSTDRNREDWPLLSSGGYWPDQRLSAAWLGIEDDPKPSLGRVNSDHLNGG